MKTPILFISHEASQTGAPIVLLHLLRWLKQNTQIMPIVLLQEGGVLQEKFEEVAQTLVWKLVAPVTVWEHRFRRLARTEQKHQRHILAQLKHLAPKLVYANTVVAAELAVMIKGQLKCPVVCHVHELQLIIQESVGNEKFTSLSKYIDCFIAASEAVAINLTNSYGISQAKIKKVHEFVPVIDSSTFDGSRQKIREEMAVPANAFLVLASGTLEWRKSPELLIQAAQQVQQHSGSMPYFVWLGGSLDSYFGVRSQYDLARAGIGSHMKFLGARGNPYDYINAADIFVLTSREDPYPLVCLEAASLGKPVICFDGSGGMPEFVEEDCGIVVPYLRTDLLAEAIIRLRDNEAERLRLGVNAANKMRSNHTVEIAASHISVLLAEILQLI